MKKEADRDIEFLCDETVMETRTVQERMLYNRLLERDLSRVFFLIFFFRTQNRCSWNLFL